MIRFLRKALKRIFGLPEAIIVPFISPHHTHYAVYLTRHLIENLQHSSDPATPARVKSMLVEDLFNAPIVFTDRFDLKYILYPTDRVYDRFYHHGYNEVTEQDFCHQFIQDGMTIFDVGANYGIYTLLFSKLAWNGHVYAFEPEPVNFHRLEVNLKLNNAQNVTAHSWAVFSSSGEVDLNIFSADRFGWHTLGSPEIAAEEGKITPRDTITVLSISLDEYCNEHAIQQIDLLKIDVEGAELDVLQGCRELLGAGRIRAVLFEVSIPMLKGMQHSPEDVFSFLRGFDMTIHAFQPNGVLSSSLDKIPDAIYLNLMAMRAGEFPTLTR